MNLTNSSHCTRSELHHCLYLNCMLPETETMNLHKGLYNFQEHLGNCHCIWICLLNKCICTHMETGRMSHCSSCVQIRRKYDLFQLKTDRGHKLCPYPMCMSYCILVLFRICCMNIHDVLLSKRRYNPMMNMMHCRTG